MKQKYVINKVTMSQYNLGYKQGYHDANEKNQHISTNAVYAIILLALHTEFGWGGDECERLLAKTVDISESIIPDYGSVDALIKDVSDEIGLEF